VATAVEEATGERVVGSRRVGGGCINEAFVVELGGSRVFVKTNRASPPQMFQREAEGLNALRDAGCLRVPEPIAVGDDPAFLVMEFIGPPPSGGKRTDVGAALGRGLAELHRTGSGSYGFSRDNYIGSLPQENGITASWVEFFGERRLRPQVIRAGRSGALSAQQVRRLETVIDRLGDILPDAPHPALLHGDLWGGNYMVGAHGEPVLIDPAVYRGDREVELAFTELFGGFSRSFYDAYRAHWPLSPGYEDRRALYNAYPLLVHVNLFGGGYGAQLMAAIGPYAATG
jgi:fructosamine-3-kinase